ncbi:unnamed protein product [Sympodiomycopsis kandeliae]
MAYSAPSSSSPSLFVNLTASSSSHSPTASSASRPPPPGTSMNASAPRVPASPPTPAPSPRPMIRPPRIRPPPGNLQSDFTPDNSLADYDDYGHDHDHSMSSEYEDAVTSATMSLSTSQSQWQTNPQSLTRAATLLLPTLPSSARVTLLSDLLMLLSSQELAQISSFVSSRLRIDFLSSLPIEVSLHVLSFIDDPLTLARASQVSRFWRSLVNDEHTWEAMCLKYRYRYRRPSIMYNRSASGKSSAGTSATSDADLLASLYRRYRQRGMDPSNARNELRTLHDLFLAKQRSHEAGTSTSALLPSASSMSSSDLRFYEQLEQIVQEESRERYGTDQHQRIRDDIAAISETSPVISAASSAQRSSASNIGRLSTGPPATRFAPRTPPAIRSRLPPLTGVAARSAFEPNANHRARTTTPQPAAHPHNHPNSALSSWTGGLGLPWGLSDLISLPSSFVGGGGPSNNATPVISSHATATTPITSVGLGYPSSSTQQQHRAATYAGPPAAQTHDHASPAYQGAGQQRFFSANLPTTEEDAFSYKAHFKRNYLTESNWHRGGRLLTHHVSSESGSVCTCTAMDQRWLIIGMANGKIHVFDSRTGLYERTLGGGGTDSGVWCLALVSKTRGAKKKKGKGKAASKFPSDKRHQQSKYQPRPASGPAENGESETEYVTPDGNIRLVEHDPALTSQVESHESPVASSSASSTWFPYTRSVLQRASARFSTPTRQSNSPSTDTIGGYPRDMVEAAPAFVQESILASARPETEEERRRLEGTVAEVGETLARIRREHGITGQRRIPRPNRREAHPDDHTDAHAGSSSRSTAVQDDEDDSMHIDDEDEQQATTADEDENGPDESEDEEDAHAEYEGFSMGIGGSANGLGTLCGSTKGYGNDSAILVSGGCDRDVKVWDLETGELKFTMRGHASTVRCLRVLEGRPIAVSGGRDSTVRVWDISTGRLLRILAGHVNSVRCLEVAGNRVATGSYDCTCRIWDVDTGECQHVLRGHYNQIYCVAFDGNRIATGSLDSTVRVWSASTGELLGLLQGHTALVGTLQLSNNILVSGGSDGRILVYSLQSHTDISLLYAICAHDNSVSCFQFDEHFILTGGNDGAVRLWNLYDGSFIRELTKPSNAVWKLAFRDDKVLAMCKRLDESLSMQLFDFRPCQ